MKTGLVETLRIAPPMREAVVSVPRRAALPWRPIVLEAGAIWLVTRLAYVALTYYTIVFSGDNRTLFNTSVPVHTLLASWGHWDALWYIRIATQGYYNLQSAAFFPLYPLLIHLLTVVVGTSHAVAAALLIANLGTLGAFIGIALLAANETGVTAPAWRTLRVFIAYPLALFLTAPYTEGLFVAFATGALLCARRGSWRWAALWALLSGLTRPTGVALVLPLLWEYGRQHGWWRPATWASWRAGGWRELVHPKALAEAIMVLGSVPAAVGAYMFYCWVHFRHPLIFLNADKIYWGHVAMAPWTTLWLATRNLVHTPMLSAPQARLLMDYVPLLVFIVVALIGIRRLPLMFTLYTFGILYLSIATPRPLLQDVLVSVGRYLITAVPVFFLLGQWIERRPWLDALLITTGLLVGAILTLVYLHDGLVY